MQGKIILALVGLLIGIGQWSYLELRRAEVSDNGTSNIFASNTASLSDVVLEKANEAFLPENSDAIEYEISLDTSHELNYDDYFEDAMLTASSDMDDNLALIVEEEVAKILAQREKENANTIAKAEVKTPALNASSSKRNILSNTAREVSTVAPNLSRSSSMNRASLNRANPVATRISTAVKEQLASIDNQAILSNDKSFSSNLKDDELVKIQPSITDYFPEPEFVQVDNMKTELKEAEEMLISSTNPVAPTVDLDSFANTADSAQLEKNTTIASKEEDVNPFGVIISQTNIQKEKTAPAKRADISFSGNNTANTSNSPFVKAFSAIKPEKKSNDVASIRENNKKNTSVSSKTAYVNPVALKKDLHKAYMSDNQYLSSAETIGDELLMDDIATLRNKENNYASEMKGDKNFRSGESIEDALDGGIDVNQIMEKISNKQRGQERAGGPLKIGERDVLEMKISFQDGSSAVSGESVNLLRSFGQIAIEHPTNSIEIALPQSVMSDSNLKKLTARRLSLVSNILRDNGISDKQIYPVLSNRDVNSFAFRVITNDPYDIYQVGKRESLFEDDSSIKEYEVLKW